MFGVAAFAAFLGDVALYWLGLRGVRSRNGSRWLHRLQDRVEQGTLDRPRSASSTRHGAAVLVLSRLIPAGRIPVMVACLLSRDADAALRARRRPGVPGLGRPRTELIGILGGSLFPEPWQGVVARGGDSTLRDRGGRPSGYRRAAPGTSRPQRRQSLQRDGSP